MKNDSSKKYENLTFIKNYIYKEIMRNKETNINKLISEAIKKQILTNCQYIAVQFKEKIQLKLEIELKISFKPKACK